MTTSEATARGGVLASANGAVYAAQGVSRRYGGVQALHPIDFEVNRGEVRALLGANGAGKSTLVKILAGAERPDTGRLTLVGETVNWSSVAHASRRGVAVVSQELNLYPDLDVLSNLFPLRPPTKGFAISRREMATRAAPTLDAVGLRVNPDRKLGELRLGDRQLVEIARALLEDPNILILDEPNSALKANETQRLLQVVRDLSARGVAILFVSHFLEEVHSVADRITVLRDGRTVVGGVSKRAITVPEIVREMIGDQPPSSVKRNLNAARAPGAADQGLRIHNITLGHQLKDVSLTVHPGEIAGLAGLEGSGVQTLVDVIFGVVRPDSGHGTLPSGKPLPHNTAQAVKSGVALVPADRKKLGVMLEMSIAENVSHVRAGALGRNGFVLRPRQLARLAAERCQELRVKANDVEVLAGQLSGGNQQKVVFGKWLEAQPQLVVLDDPTRGVDIGAKAEMHDIVRRLASDGCVVLVASSDLAELAELCDRVTIFFQGRAVSDVPHAKLSEHNLLAAINSGAPDFDPVADHERQAASGTKPRA